MVYAQIKSGQVVNTIVVDEESPLDLLTEGFDALIQVDTLTPQPGIGWGYDGSSFSEPVHPIEEE